MALLFVPGCIKGPKVRHKPAWLAGSSDIRRYMETARQDPDADVRRAAVEQIGRSFYRADVEVRDVLMRVARTDTSSNVRCAAIDVLALEPDVLTVHTLLAVLGASQRDDDALILPADERTRWEAARKLQSMAAGGHIDDTQMGDVRALAADLLRTDGSRDVRICAAGVLGHDPDMSSARVLVEALGQRDFAVVYEAHRSLQRLTGQSIGYDASAWLSWLESTDNPFDGAERSGGSWWSAGVRRDAAGRRVS